MLPRVIFLRSIHVSIEGISVVRNSKSITRTYELLIMLSYKNHTDVLICHAVVIFTFYLQVPSRILGLPPWILQFGGSAESGNLRLEAISVGLQ